MKNKNNMLSVRRCLNCVCVNRMQFVFSAREDEMRLWTRAKRRRLKRSPWLPPTGQEMSLNFFPIIFIFGVKRNTVAGRVATILHLLLYGYNNNNNIRKTLF